MDKRSRHKVERALPYWLSHPTTITENVLTDQLPVDILSEHLDENTLKTLKENGIRNFFPVQAKVIPELMSSVDWCGYMVGKAGMRPCDICCSTPTGSGKTLAFVIPIVQILKTRVNLAVRCLVVVPVGDLAEQVYRVFSLFCQGTNLKVGLITGLKTFAKEQASLVKKGFFGFHSRVDIIVCTPGRLVDHINMTPGFDLTNLRFLVIDEADRLMEDIKQNWLNRLERAVFREEEYGKLENDRYMQQNPNACIRKLPGPLTGAERMKPQIPLQKLLFSATLTRQPELLHPLKLFHPKLFTTVGKSDTSVAHSEPKAKAAVNSSEFPSVADEADDDVEEPVADVQHQEEDGVVKKYDTPIGLTEKFLQCEKSDKVLVLMHFLKHLNFKQVLCFTNSVESTHRLCHLLKLIGGITVKEISSKLHISKRGRILRQFGAGKLDVLVCSDAMARGMDVENVQYVILYDVPPVIKRYIHRVGRTARAGRSGTAITLLERKEVFHFKKMLRKAGKIGIKEMKLKPSELKPYVESVQKALSLLPEVLKMETDNLKRQQQH